MAGFGWLAAVEVDRCQGASKAENYGRGPWQEGLRNSTLYITLVALQCKCILATYLIALASLGYGPRDTRTRLLGGRGRAGGLQAGVYSVCIQGSKELGAGKHDTTIRQSYGSYKRMEAWYEWQIGQDKQSDTPV